MTTHDMAQRIADVRHRIAAAAQAADRDPARVTLIGICKTVGLDASRQAFDLGVSDLGENRVADLVAKRDAIRGARWHLVGQLQRNKAGAAVDAETLIHSVDRKSLVDTLARLAAARDVVQRILIQVNVGSDPAKGGCRLNEVDELVAYAGSYEHLHVQGLMTVPPMASAPHRAVEEAATHFGVLRACRDRVVNDVPTARELSMGMSADLEAAVAHGATMVRIGTDIFGPRTPAIGQEGHQ